MKIKNQRQLRGLSQMRLAHLAQISRFRLFMAENAYLDLTQEEEKKIDDVFRTFREVKFGGRR